MKPIYIFFLHLLFLQPILAQQSLESVEINEAWLQKIDQLSPQTPTVVGAKRKVLLFSLYTGFEHWVIPHTSAVLKALASKSGAFEIVETTDINYFRKKQLAKFDLVVINNTCSKRDHRNIFYDALETQHRLPETELLKKAAAYEKALFDYMRRGGGLAVLHGAITMQNNTPEFGRMVGGTFDYHPVQQQFNVKLVDPAHPLVAAFDGQGFTHIDEPYIFSNAYFDYNFRPLLFMEPKEIKGIRDSTDTRPRYIAWIKQYGRGRVFYCSPSHNAQSYDNPKLLKFLLDGMQYAAGDIKCDDSPIKKQN